MATLLLAEVTNGALSDITARALTAALQIGAPVEVLVVGQNVAAAAEAAAKLSGVAKVQFADDALYANGLAEPLAALLVALAPGYDAILAPSSPFAKNVLPRAAALLDVMQVSDITKVAGPEDVRAADLRRQCDPDGRVDRRQGDRHRPHRVFRRDGRRRRGGAG